MERLDWSNPEVKALMVVLHDQANLRPEENILTAMGGGIMLFAHRWPGWTTFEVTMCRIDDTMRFVKLGS